jgi:ATP-dependent helicase HrpA
VPDLLDQCALQALRTLAADAGAVRTKGAFDALAERVRPEWVSTTDQVVRAAAQALEQATLTRRMLDGARPVPANQAAWDDLDRQYRRLVHPGFVADTGWPRLRELSRYLRAMQQRWERIGGRLDRDRADMLMIQALHDEWQRAVEKSAEALSAEASSAGAEPPLALVEIGWLLEELRVSKFAATIKAKVPVSEQRVLKALAAL